MSRGFVKEGDQEEVPMVPPRAYLPSGVANYVTPEGLNLLIAERKALLDERDGIKESGQEADVRVMRNFINAKLELLENRIKCAQVVNVPKKSKNPEIAFGTTVTMEMDGVEMSVQVTGVDEANGNRQKIPFTSPLAKSMMGRRKGDSFEVVLPSGKKNVKIVSIQ